MALLCGASLPSLVGHVETVPEKNGRTGRCGGFHLFRFFLFLMSNDLFR